MNLNTNNKQLAFQYKPKTNEYVLETITDTMVLSTDNIKLKYYQGEDLFCVDVGYSIDGDVSKMSFKIDDLIVYPVVLKTPDKLQQQVINNQAIYIISEDYNFKSIIFIPIAQLNKTFEYTITSYNSCISSFVLDQIGKKFNDTAIATLATQVSQNNEALGDNVQTALDILFNRYNIPLYFTVYPEDDGTFDDKKRPANYYYNLYGITTTWKKRFATTGAFERHEGGFSEENRSGLLQGDAIRNITGDFGYYEIAQYNIAGGVFSRVLNSRTNNEVSVKNGLSHTNADIIKIDLTNIFPNNIGSEIRSINIKKETWELKSINGVSIWK